MKMAHRLAFSWAFGPRLTSVLALLLWATACGGAAPPADTVVWMMSDYPPASIKEGPFANQGYLDSMLHQMLMPRMPEFRHKIDLGPSTRVLRQLETTPNACSPGGCCRRQWSPLGKRAWPPGLVL